MKVIKENSENNKKKFKFGRNPLSFLIVVCSLIFIFFVACIIRGLVLINVTYDVTPYKTNVTDDYTSKFTNIEGVFDDIDMYEYKDIKRNIPDSSSKKGCYTTLFFDIYFYCKNYLYEDADRAQFVLDIQWNAQTKEYTKDYGLKYLPGSSTKNVYATLCLAKDKVKYCEYLDSPTTFKLGPSITASSQTLKMTNLGCFPLVSKNTFPLYHKEIAPDAYLFLYFQSAGEDEAKKICIHYTYDEYMTIYTNGAAKK